MRSSIPGPSDPVDATFALANGALEDRRHCGEPASERPHDERHSLRADPGEARRLRILGRGAHAGARLGAAEEPRKAADERGEHDDGDDVVGTQDHVTDMPLLVECSREGLVRTDVGQDGLDEQEDLSRADGRDHEDDLWRLAEARHERKLEQPAEQQADDGDQREGGIEVPVVVDREAYEQRRGQRAELAEGEVDDAVRAVDEDDADGEHADGEAAHRTAEDDLVRGIEREQLRHGFAPRKTARARSSRCASSAAAPSNRI